MLFSCCLYHDGAICYWLLFRLALTKTHRLFAVHLSYHGDIITHISTWLHELYVDVSQYPEIYCSFFKVMFRLCIQIYNEKVSDDVKLHVLLDYVKWLHAVQLYVRRTHLCLWRLIQTFRILMKRVKKKIESNQAFNVSAHGVISF